MRSLDEALSTLAYHPATADTAPRHSALRDLAMSTAEQAWELIPDGPEKTLALRGLQDFLMHGNCAIAMLAPPDLGETRGVARVLPDSGPDGSAERQDSER